MTVSPSGLVSKPVDELRTLLAALSSVQSFLGVADSAAALARIYPEFAADSAARPFIAVWYPPDAAAWSVRSSALLPETNQLEIVLQRDTDSAYDDSGSEADAWYDFANEVGAIIEDLLETAGTDYGGTSSYLNVRTCRVVGNLTRTDKDDRETLGDICQARLAVEWE